MRKLLAQFLCGSYDVLAGQTKLLQQIHSGTGVTELVVDADALNGSGALLGQDAADSFAQAADDGVLLAGEIGRAHV